MSKRTNTPVAVEIDASYESHVNSLDTVTGHISDFAIEPHRPQRPQQPVTWVPEQRPAAIARHATAPEITAMNQASHVLDVPPTATQHIEVKTSSVDRAKGFLIANVPLFAAFALGVVLVAWVGAGVPIASVDALVTFWLAFVLAWLVGYVYTLSMSAEGIAMFEARSKWRVIEREQRERWAHYKQLNGGK